VTRRTLRTWMVTRRVLVQLSGALVWAVLTGVVGRLLRTEPLVVPVVLLLAVGVLASLFQMRAGEWLDRLDARDRERWRTRHDPAEG